MKYKYLKERDDIIFGKEQSNKNDRKVGNYKSKLLNSIKDIIDKYNIKKEGNLYYKFIGGINNVILTINGVDDVSDIFNDLRKIKPEIESNLKTKINLTKGNPKLKEYGYASDKWLSVNISFPTDIYIPKY